MAASSVCGPPARRRPGCDVSQHRTRHSRHGDMLERQWPQRALCHPGYAAPQDILLLLPAYDVADRFDSGGAPRFGIHHETARIACAVKANCRWDGYLSGERNNNAERVAARPDDVLLADRYYFHVPHTQQPSPPVYATP